MTKSALGRGLGALLGGVTGVPKSPPTTPPPSLPSASVESTHTIVAAAAATTAGVQRVAINRVRPSALQPRKDFSASALRELADSIQSQGIVQPLLVRPAGDGYELIAGERRWRAAQLAGLVDVPVVVRDADDRTVLELALVENLQRENLNPIEEAQGYSQLMAAFNLTQEEAAAKVGKGRVAVANAVRLLKLDSQVQAFLRDGHLSVGHAKVILGLSNSGEQRIAAEKVVRDSLNVRDTEQLVAGLQAGSAGTSGRSGTKGKPAVATDANVADLQNRLQQHFGTKVSLRYAKGKGAVEIRFFNDDDLNRILKVAGLNLD